MIDRKDVNQWIAEAGNYLGCTVDVTAADAIATMVMERVASPVCLAPGGIVTEVSGDNQCCVILATPSNC